MKLFILIPFFIILSYADFCLSQENIIGLTTDLVEINQKSINGELNTVLTQQKAGEVEQISTDTLELQVANETLKKKLDEAVPLSCHLSKEETKTKNRAKEVTKDGWEVVLLVKASHENLGDSQTTSYANSNYIHRYHYSELLWAHDSEELEKIFKNQIQNMSPFEITDYISFIGGSLPYDYERAEGKSGHKEGVRNIFDLISSQRSYYIGDQTQGAFGGICGDIHFAMGELVRMAQEQGKISDCEYITMSYQATNIGHVIGGCAYKDGSFLALNYNEMRLIENPNGVASLSAGNAKSRMPDIGTRMRIFSTTDEKAEHIATLRNEIGSFLYAMNLKEEKHSAGPLYEDYSVLSTSLNQNSQKIIEKENRTITKEINQGLRFYTGKLQGGQDIFGVAVYRETNKTNDKNQMSLFHSNSLSANNIKFPASTILEKNPVNLYFLHHLGAEIPIIQKGNFRLIAELSEQIDFNGTKTGKDTSLDADLLINAKLKSVWQSKDHKIKASGLASVDHVIGFKEERLVADLSTIAKNIKFTTNAINFQGHIGRQIAGNKTLGVGTNITTTQVGSKYEMYTDFSSGIHRIYIQYENGSSGFGAHKMNLLPNTGKGLEAGYHVSIPYRKTNIEASTKLSYDMNKHAFISAGVKLKINHRKKKNK